MLKNNRYTQNIYNMHNDVIKDDIYVLRILKMEVHVYGQPVTLLINDKNIKI